MTAKRWMVNVPANITVYVDTDGPEPTAGQVGDAVGKYVELKNGEHFDSDDFEVVDAEDIV